MVNKILASLIEEAEIIVREHPSKDARFFAENVYAYLTRDKTDPPTWLCYECRQQWIISQAALAQRGKCPHGDPLCPCQDGDACHYEGKNPMTPPSQSGTGEKSTIDTSIEFEE